MAEITVKEAAENIKITEAAVVKAINQKRLAYSRRVGRNYLIDEDEVAAYIERTKNGRPKKQVDVNPSE